MDIGCGRGCRRGESNGDVFPLEWSWCAVMSLEGVWTHEASCRPPYEVKTKSWKKKLGFLWIFQQARRPVHSITLLVSVKLPASRCSSIMQMSPLDSQRRLRGPTLFRPSLVALGVCGFPALHDNKRITLSVYQAQSDCCDRLAPFNIVHAGTQPLHLAAQRAHRSEVFIQSHVEVLIINHIHRSFQESVLKLSLLLAACEIGSKKPTSAALVVLESNTWVIHSLWLSRFLLLKKTLNATTFQHYNNCRLKYNLGLDYYG